MKTRLWVTMLALFALALSASGQTAKSRTVRSSDGSLMITIPSDWTTQELNEAAELQVGSEEQNAYLIVLIEKKDDLFGWNLERHSYVTLGTLLASVDLPKVSGPKSIRIGGWPALQHEIRGASDGTNIVYLHTTVETPAIFAQVLAWTVPSREAANRKTLESAIQSIRAAD